MTESIQTSAENPPTTRLQRRILAAEAALYDEYGIAVEESSVRLPSSGLRLRVLATGAGPDLVLLHGSTLTAAVWAPLLPALTGYRVHLVDLPGHGLSGPAFYRPGELRQAAVALIDDLLTALGCEAVVVLAHSVGGMYALWHTAARPGRISCLILAGAPGGALPGLRLRMPVSLLTVPVIGAAMLRAPAPRAAYRRLLVRGMGSSLPAAPRELIDVLRLSARQPESAASVASLHCAADRFRTPRPETVMTGAELARITAPALFVWGREDPFLAPATARPIIAQIPGAVLREVPGGHCPWLDDPAACGLLITEHLRDAGLAPASPRRAAP